MDRQRAILIDGQWLPGGGRLEVRDKFTGEVFAEVGTADQTQVSAAVYSAKRAFAASSLTPYRRYEILMRAMKLVDERRQSLISTMVAETGFTVAETSNDLNRAVQTLQVSAEEAKRIVGEVVPIASAPDQNPERLAFTIRVPVGVVAAITPFNSPLNTVAHKVAPAIAAGNTVVLKPSTYTPVTAVVFCQILLDAGLPPGHVNLVNGAGNDVGAWLLAEQDIDFYTFTGSTEVGRAIQRGAGLRRTQLELGNISATIVCADADLDRAVPRCIASSFRKAGQVCTSVQRLYVESVVLEEVGERLLAEAKNLRAGDPRDPATGIGPLISMSQAARAVQWVQEAVASGARLLCGGGGEGALMQPTILANVRPEMKVMGEEIFAPVISLVPFADLGEAIAAADATPFGLAAGIFTRDLNKGLKAARQLRVGTFHINDTSSSRVDLMPYGGVKQSGFGQEGPKYAIRDMTEERLVTVTPTL